MLLVSSMRSRSASSSLPPTVFLGLGSPISTGMTASTPYVSQKGVSPVVV